MKQTKCKLISVKAWIFSEMKVKLDIRIPDKLKPLKNKSN